MEMGAALIRKYTGEIPWTYFAYVASEGMMGIAVAPNQFDYLLLPEAGFLE